LALDDFHMIPQSGGAVDVELRLATAFVAVDEQALLEGVKLHGSSFDSMAKETVSPSCGLEGCIWCELNLKATYQKPFSKQKDYELKLWQQRRWKLVP
jgi:hypothetical protein